jgi:hypothetical protein
MSPRSLVPHATGAGLLQTQNQSHAQAIRSVTGALLTTALPALSRRSVPELALQAQHRAEHLAFRSLVSAACYLSFNTEGDPESVLEAIQILHDLSTRLRVDKSLSRSSPPSPVACDEDRIWETARYRWERQKLVDVALRFVKSPHATRRRQPRLLWQRFRAAWLPGK